MENENRVVLTEKKGYIGYIVLNRPEKLNAFTREMYYQLAEAADYMEEQDDVKVVVIKGTGRCFSAGFDLGSTGGNDTHLGQRRAYEKYSNRTRKKIWDMTKPTIAQVHSHCLGGAHDIALACDFCIVTENANLGVPEIQFGQGATFLCMPYMINLRKCREYLLTGKSYDGRTAYEIGIANKCVPEAELDNAVRELAKELALVPASAMALQKRGINRAVEAMGFALAREQWLDTLCLGMLWESEEVNLFNQKVKELGTKNAIKWRNEYYSKMEQD